MYFLFLGSSLATLLTFLIAEHELHPITVTEEDEVTVQVNKVSKTKVSSGVPSI